MSDIYDKIQILAEKTQSLGHINSAISKIENANQDNFTVAMVGDDFYSIWNYTPIVKMQNFEKELNLKFRDMCLSALKVERDKLQIEIETFFKNGGE